MEKCCLCGKGSIFNIVLKCNKCSECFCSKHESEQFIRYSYENISYNYPDGKAFSMLDFVCYFCRTNKIPQQIEPSPNIIVGICKNMRKRISKT